MKFLTSLFLVSSLVALGQDHTHHHHDHGQAPIGVMGAHRHDKGEWMTSYRYMYMRMQQNYRGTSQISDAAVLADPSFRIVPTNMDMHMHMFGLMYGATDRITIMAMFNYVQMSMDHLTMAGTRFRTHSEGLGDASLGAIIGLHESDSVSLDFGLNILLPTAETDEMDFLPPAGRVARLPYPMQLGSGSWGLSPTLTWTAHEGSLTYGAQASARFLLADNDENYRLGNSSQLTGWVSHCLNDQWSVSLRGTLAHRSNIHGRDVFIGGPVQTARPELHRRTEAILSAGVSYLEPRSGLRASLELGKTVWRDVAGPQLTNDFSVTLGLQFDW